MRRVDNMIFKANRIAEPPLTRLEQYIQENEYVGLSFDDLLEMMSEDMSTEQNRKVMCALALGGNTNG